MKAFCGAICLWVLLIANASGQTLDAAATKFLQVARARYYNLAAAGYQGMTCAVAFNFETVPHLQPDDEGSRKLLQRARFVLAIDAKGRPTVQHSFPSDSAAIDQEKAGPLANLLTSFVGGVFQTWPSKGLQGPIPPFDSQIQVVTSTDTGYEMALRVPGAPVHVALDKAFIVKEIVSANGKLVEQPTYTDLNNFLVFSGNKAVDDTNPNGRVNVSYDLALNAIDGLFLPSAVHLKVNDNIDVRFSLSECTVKKGQVITVKPPRDDQGVTVKSN